VRSPQLDGLLATLVLTLPLSSEPIALPPQLLAFLRSIARSR
jgi:hypothetical protein